MQVLIEIDEKFYQWVKMCGIMPFITAGKVIPDNATNLDALMAVFPGVTLDKILWVDTDWAKKPYKGR